MQFRKKGLSLISWYYLFQIELLRNLEEQNFFYKGMKKKNFDFLIYYKDLLVDDLMNEIIKNAI